MPGQEMTCMRKACESTIIREEPFFTQLRGLQPLFAVVWIIGFRSMQRSLRRNKYTIQNTVIV